MGCDVHMYVEYRPKKRNPDYDRWADFGGRINPGRNYALFGALAGVRHDQPDGCIPPRGIPDDLAWQANGDWWLYVTDKGESSTRIDNSDGRVGDAAVSLMLVCLANPKEDAPRKMLLDSLQEWNNHDESGRDSDWPRVGLASRERADKWATQGSKYNADRSAIEHPDWHTPTWLTPDEYEHALKVGNGVYPEPEYHALLAAMRSLESSGNEVRCVLWFDN